MILGSTYLKFLIDTASSPPKSFSCFVLQSVLYKSDCFHTPWSTPSIINLFDLCQYKWHKSKTYKQKLVLISTSLIISEAWASFTSLSIIFCNIICLYYRRSLYIRTIDYLSVANIFPVLTSVFQLRVRYLL